MRVLKSLTLTIAVLSLQNVLFADGAKVLILGAGAAGLSAAKTLKELGVTDITILEGSNRIGGRVRSVRFGGKTIEAGANWVVGENNFLLNIVRNENVQGKVSDFESVVIKNSLGDDVTDTEGEVAWANLEAAQNRTPKVEARLDHGRRDMSLRGCLTGSGFTPVSPVEKVVEQFDYDFEYGHIPDVASCLDASSNLKLVEYQYFVQDERGFEYILQKYFEGVLEDGDPRLFLNEIVTQVYYTHSGVQVATQRGNFYTADYAIITFSIGVLKSDFVTFSPPLPNWKMDTINRLRLDNYFGIFLKFPDGMTRFWDSEEYILYADERRGFYPVWQNLEADGLYPTGTNILEIVTYGEDADRVSGMNDGEVVTEVMEMLRRVYKNPFIPNPVDVFIPNWRKDPLHLGAFVNLEPGAFNPSIVNDRLAPVGRLYFAGEAFDRDAPGFVQAAINSGRAAALNVEFKVGLERYFTYNRLFINPRQQL